MREFKALRGGQLPLHPDAAILLRHDEGRMDAMRAVLRCAFGLGVAHPHPKPNPSRLTRTPSPEPRTPNPEPEPEPEPKP